MYTNTSVPIRRANSTSAVLWKVTPQTPRRMSPSSTWPQRLQQEPPTLNHVAGEPGVHPYPDAASLSEKRERRSRDLPFRAASAGEINFAQNVIRPTCMRANFRRREDCLGVPSSSFYVFGLHLDD